MALSFINTSGNIISEDFCSQLLIETKADYVKSKSFGEEVKKIDEDIATSFELLRERWEEIRSKLLEDQFDTTQLRDRWIKPFLSLLGFDPVYIPHNLKNEVELEYNIPYRGWNSEEAPLIHMVHSSSDFDSRDKSNRTHPNKSPHDLLQQFLNTSPQSWAILINGRKIRILRDFFHSITKGFIEFDLEGIFESANTEQFRILYRMLHSSRFIGQYDKKQEDEEQQVCLLEKFHTLSRETGVKVGDNLRKQVRTAIETLGNGFAENLNPDDFDGAKVKKFYSEILNIIYRLLFLLFAEQKGWLPVKNETYARTYSINSLRERAEKADYSHDNNEDLWEGLKVTFQLVTKGYTFPNGESINAFGGQLFSDERIFHIKSPLKNNYLLKAIDALCFFTEKKLKNKINYATLAIDELGSVYESLLDYEPRLLSENAEINGRNCKRGEFILDDQSTERKTTGSYYTDSRLVAQLIESSLVPVIENTLKEKSTNEERRVAVLDLKVADIACGSGAFLTAALEKMGEYLSLIGKEEGEKPTEQELRQAKRDVLQNCIYGVDLNPMALELAKFSLWITASMPNLPLSFLDHKLKCGNSLIGATPELIEKGIPVEAYNPVILDEHTVCTDLKKRVKKELEGLSRRDKGVQTGFEFKVPDFIIEEEESEQYKHILQSQQEDAEEVAALAEEYEVVYKALRENTDWKLADTWTASFFIHKDHLDKIYPTNVVLQNIKQGNPIDEDLEDEILRVAHKYGFFHWHLEYPEVFEKGGFDCLVGNPPWEELQAEEKTFFISLPEIANSTAQKRKQLIVKLKGTNKEMYQKWALYKSSIDRIRNFIANCGLYPLTSYGKINLYSTFSERFYSLVNLDGSAAFITPSDIGTGKANSKFISTILENKSLKSFVDFENSKRPKFFPAVHPQLRFCIVTVHKNNKYDCNFQIFIRDLQELTKQPIVLSFELIEKLNPDTKTIPVFSNTNEADIAIKIYLNNPLFGQVNKNPIKRIFNLGIPTVINRFTKNKENGFFRLYEGKMFDFYNNRFANIVINEENIKRQSYGEILSIDQLKDPNYKCSSQFYSKFNEYSITDEDNDWILAYKNVASSTNSRTMIATILPKIPTDFSIRILTGNLAPDRACLILSCFNSFVYDFLLRQKLVGNNLSDYFISGQ